MSNYSNFHKAIQDRISVGDLHGGDPIWQWEIIVNQFSADIDLSIKFIRDAITDEELYWLSEVFDELLTKTKSSELLRQLSERTAKVRDPDIRSEIEEELVQAKGVAKLF